MCGCRAWGSDTQLEGAHVRAALPLARNIPDMRRAWIPAERVLEPASSNHPNEAIQLTLKPWTLDGTDHEHYGITGIEESFGRNASRKLPGKVAAGILLSMLSLHLPIV